MTIITKSFLVACLLFGSLSVWSQNFLLPKPYFKGDLYKSYETIFDVFIRTDEWTFKKKEYFGGEFMTINEAGYYENYTYFYGGLFSVDFTYEMDAQGVPISGKSVEQSISIDFRRNKAGQIEEVILKNNKTNNIIRIVTYQYKKGKLVESKLMETARDTFTLTCRINNYQILSSERRNVAGTITNLQTNEYNKEGFLSKTIDEDVDGNKINQVDYIYQYDDQGNWISRLMTDYRKDIRQLTTRNLAYRKQAALRLTKKDLIGKWVDLSEDIFIEFREEKAMFRKKKYRHEANDTYTYNPYTKEISLKTRRDYGHQSYLVEMNGGLLILQPMDRGDVIYLRKATSEGMKASEKKRFNYYLQDKPETKSFQENGLYGLKNDKGKVLIPAKYKGISAITRKVVKVSKDDKYGLIDYQGQAVTPVKYDRITLRDAGYLRYSLNGKKGLLSPLGKEITPPIYDNIWTTDYGAIIIEMEGKKGMLNLEGKEILASEFQRIGELTFNRIFASSRNGAFKLIWLNGELEVVKNFESRGQISGIDVNCFKAQGKSGYGLLDSLGNDILAPQYEDLTRATARLLVAENKDKFGLVNVEGTQLTSLKYDRIITAYQGKNDSEMGGKLGNAKAAAMFLQDEYFGYLDGFGKEIEPAAPRNYKTGWFEVAEIRAVARLYFPKYWKNNQSTIRGLDKEHQVTISYNTEFYEGDALVWIKSKKVGNVNVKSMQINGKPAFSIVERSNMGYQQDYRKETVYLIVDEKTMLVIDFSVKYYQYPKYAQDFFNILHSVEILK